MSLRLKKRSDSKFWYITGTDIAGRRINKSTKTTDKKQAEVVKSRLEKELFERGVFGEQATASFAAALNIYLDIGGSDRFLEPILLELGSTKLRDINPTTLLHLSKKLYPNAKASTLNRQLYTPVIAIMNCASRHELVAPRHWPRPQGHAINKPVDYLWPDEVERLHEAAASHLKPIILFMVGTGARSSEALTLRIEDIHDRQAFLRNTKNGDHRFVEIPSTTKGDLFRGSNNPANRAFLSGSNRPLASIKKSFATAAKKANITATPHTLRHTWATWFYAQTQDVLRLKELGGWKSDQYLRYTKVAPRELKQEILKYGWDFGEIVNDKHARYTQDAQAREGA